MNRKRTMLVVMMLSLFGMAMLQAVEARTTTIYRYASSSEISVTYGSYFSGDYSDTHNVEVDGYQASMSLDDGEEHLQITVDYSSDLPYVREIKIAAWLSASVEDECEDGDVFYTVKLYFSDGTNTYSFQPMDIWPTDMHTYSYGSPRTLVKVTLDIWIDHSEFWMKTSGLDYLRVKQIMPY